MNNVNYVHVRLAGMRCVIMNTVRMPNLEGQEEYKQVASFKHCQLLCNYYCCHAYLYALYP